MLVVHEREGGDEQYVGNTAEPVHTASASAVSERDVTVWHAAQPSFAMGNGMNKVSDSWSFSADLLQQLWLLFETLNIYSYRQREHILTIAIVESKKLSMLGLGIRVIVVC